MANGYLHDMYVYVKYLMVCLYVQLATDIDRRVREQAHIALEAVVKE